MIPYFTVIDHNHFPSFFLIDWYLSKQDHPPLNCTADNEALLPTRGHSTVIILWIINVTKTITQFKSWNCMRVWIWRKLQSFADTIHQQWTYVPRNYSISLFSTEMPPGCLEAVARELVVKDGASKHTYDQPPASSSLWGRGRERISRKRKQLTWRDLLFESDGTLPSCMPLETNNSSILKIFLATRDLNVLFFIFVF